MSEQSAVQELCEKLSGHWSDYVARCFEKGQYEIHLEKAPEEYEVRYSEICFGWLTSSDPTSPVVATFASGERGNDDYDESVAGLHIWFQEEQGKKNSAILGAAKALISKSIGFGEFKSIIKKNS